MMRAMIQDQAAPILATQARGQDPIKQVMLAMAHLMGVVLARHVVALEPLHEADVDELAGDLGPVIQRYFDGTHAAHVPAGDQL